MLFFFFTRIDFFSTRTNGWSNHQYIHVVYWNTFGWSLDAHLCKRALLSMFYKPDRSGSTTVTFSKYMTRLYSSGHLESSSVTFIRPWIFLELGHRIKYGLEWSMAPRSLGVKSWSETLNTKITVKLYYFIKTWLTGWLNCSVGSAFVDVFQS